MCQRKEAEYQLHEKRMKNVSSGTIFSLSSCPAGHQLSHDSGLSKAHQSYFTYNFGIVLSEFMQQKVIKLRSITFPRYFSLRFPPFRIERTLR